MDTNCVTVNNPKNVDGWIFVMIDSLTMFSLNLISDSKLLFNLNFDFNFEDIGKNLEQSISS